ncbi:P-loop containing nucleoside triphosphate hydrolase protein [Hypoxylon trugodes]|uniref:P-loop containing nucleoside triphosphate hydrolase protein n=1 Tax=Hypoxylon trugodes TaxID=326681 RepID=UPI002195CD37|nr:P-loop containing nucleoside triphosphate hydrolase protein [Hypoxylon trugodes]KAI1387124.1 P-loop containing nucleoside triphosphate hydrolase protein [Hypoxylon trugodes]
MVRTREGVKHERNGSPPANVKTDMGPPSTPSRRGGVAPTEYSDSQSIAHTFIRSYAPSAETGPRKDDDTDLVFMEMRRGPDSFGPDRQSSPISQSAEHSFNQRNFGPPLFADIGQKQKAYNDTLGDLQALGVSHVIALPELVLVGDQSSGKSTLMSSLARVNLPRSAGVCTRCPLHIRLISSRTDRWSCTVSLQRDYDFQPPFNRKPRTSDVTAAKPFPPWVKLSHRDIKTFKTIYEPSEIEEVLRWAQIAILNHHRNFDLFIPGEGAIAKMTSIDEAASQTEAQFSPNIVALEIKGPGLPDLSFYDLPGVFQSPEKEEDEYIVKVVKNLTREYIKREKAIIMWALPMNVDMENSISLPIIREAKAANRTIGVMTKADQLPRQNVPNWLAKFQDPKKFVGHGFFATSRPPDQALEDATRYEALFFDRKSAGFETWPEEFAPFADRCGVEVLLEYLSCKLEEAFTDCLPSIKNMVHKHLTAVDKELKSLPELPSNVEHEVKKSLIKFLSQVKIAMGNTAFSSQWNTLNSQFQECIFKVKPTCKVKDSDLQTIDISGGDSEATIGSPAKSPQKRPRPSDATVRNAFAPAKRPRQELPTTPVKHEDGQTSDMSRASSVTAAVEPNLLKSKLPNPFSRFFNLGRCAMDIRDIRNKILRNKKPGMPRDLVPIEVRETLCMNAVKKWEPILETYISKTSELLVETTKDALEESLGLLRRRLIFRRCQSHLDRFIAREVAAQEAHLTDMFNSETYQLYMMNDDAFHRYKAQEMEQLKRVRTIIRLKASTFLDWEYPVKRLEEMPEEEKIKERKMLDTHSVRLQKDPYDTEIEVAGFVRGYYMMAAARFVEGATMSVNSNLLRTLREDQLDMSIEEEFHIYDNGVEPEMYTELMEEDKQTATRRAQLREEKLRLKKAMYSINSLEDVSRAEKISNDEDPDRSQKTIENTEDEVCVMDLVDEDTA